MSQKQQWVKNLASHTPVEMKVEGLEKLLSIAFNPRFILL